MEDDDFIDRAISDIADGKLVDWPAQPPVDNDPVERERLESLQILERIAALLRSSMEPTPGRETPGPAADSTTLTEPVDRKGEPWGRYILLEVVGSGGFGRVYRAWDPMLQHEIAIKILHEGFADDVLKKRLLKEGRTLAKVRDANVVRVLGVESHGDRVGLCMEFVHGQTLDDRLRAHGTMNAREAILVGQDICRALAAIHRAGFIHRDIKARNVMRERAGRIVVMDLGTGRQFSPFEALRDDGHIAGTPVYMAPEVLAGEPASPRSDIFCVGVLLYYLVTGQYPVEGTTFADIRAAHMSAKRTAIGDRRSDLPRAFIRIVELATAPNPSSRCQTAGDLLDALIAADAEVVGLRSAAPRAIVVAASTVVVLIGILACGILNNLTFNHLLGRSDFADEGVLDWFTWGFKSIVAPMFLLMLTLIFLSLLLGLRDGILRAWPKARALDKQATSAIHRFKLDQLGTLSSWALIVATTALIGASWYFSPLLGALTGYYPDISLAPASQLALLSPARQALHENYRLTFIFVSIVSLLAWYPAVRLAIIRRERLNPMLLLGGIVVAVLSIVMLDFPYRIFSQNDRLDVAAWRGSRCYILGERRGEVLLFCPQLTPRSRIVRENSGELERLPDLPESPFSQFSDAQ